MKGLFYKMPVAVQRKMGWRLRDLQTWSGRRNQRALFEQFNRLSPEGKKKWVFDQVRVVALFAQRNNPFYNRYYREKGFDAADMRSFEDLKEIPVVTKELLRAAGDEWLQPLPGQLFGNTGGTSGNPLKFCLSRTQGIRERFYMSQIWSRIGCSFKHTRAVFRGLNLGNRSWVYNPEADAYFINMYRSLDETAGEIEAFFSTQRVEYLHGYPSTIYAFASNCLREENMGLQQNVRRHLRGVLLGSEYPAPQYREVIEKAFSVPTISWYGHSEKVILAAENGLPFTYEPFHSYGFCEAVPFEDGNMHLVGTCYDNMASPFIRYDTGDSIEPEQIENGLLASFRVENGRLGEFVIDQNNHPVSLTAFVFGRHHKVFEHAEFIQISQDRPGHALLHVTTRHPIPAEQLTQWFDLTNVDMKFDIKCREQPVRTRQGKIPLLILKNN